MTIILEGHMMKLSQEVSLEDNPGMIRKAQIWKFGKFLYPVKSTLYKRFITGRPSLGLPRSVRSPMLCDLGDIGPTRPS